MKLTPFSISIYKYKVKDWDEKRKKLLQKFSNSKCKLVGNVISSQIEQNANIFSHEIKMFEDDIKLKLSATEIWFQKYENKMDHGIHNHGSVGFSSVCFIEFIKNIHTPTVFVSPFSNHITDEFEMYAPDVEEGDIIFFPSNLLHYVPTNLSNISRTIASFNLCVNDVIYINSYANTLKYS